MKPLPKGLVIAGVLLLIGSPLTGLLLTVIGMIQAFHTLGANGISDPRMLSAHIATVLTATTVGMIVGAIGLVVAAVGGILHFANRPSQIAAG